MDQATFLYSVERLVHFQCGVCQKWWSIGDAPHRDFWFCPWCGAKLVLVEPNTNDSESDASSS
ncbi:MAG: hypothetical protein KAX40_05240 [Herpetosiphon sp.]|nr:hypothetical protein [Herpetosiphon sp.]